MDNDKISFITDKLEITLKRFFINELSKKNPDESLLDKYFRKCISMIHKLYENGIWHNDAHLDNFMLDKKGKLYIIDFGLSEYGGNKDGDEASKHLLNEYKHISVSLYKIYREIPKNNRVLLDRIVKNNIKEGNLYDLIHTYLISQYDIKKEEEAVLKCMFDNLGLINDFDDLLLAMKKRKRISSSRLSDIIESLRQKSGKYYREKKFWISEYIALSLKFLDERN